MTSQQRQPFDGGFTEMLMKGVMGAVDSSGAFRAGVALGAVFQDRPGSAQDTIDRMADKEVDNALKATKKLAELLELEQSARDQGKVKKS